MGQTIKIKRGNRLSIPSSLEDGEFFLIKDDGKLIIKNGESIIELVGSSEIESLSSQLSSLADVVNSVSENIISLNDEMNLKLTSPPGQKGQILGYIENNKIEAVDMPELGTSTTVSSEPPENPKTNDFWFQIV